MIQRKFCSHKPTLIYSSNDINYHAADESGGKEFSGNLIINLTQFPGIKVASNVWDIPQLSKHMKSFPEELSIMWEDFMDPPVKLSFWQALHSYIKNKKYNDVCFHCLQGHGRTGTAMCAMLIANQGMDAESAIIHIRDTYCQSAVETDIQILYLFELDSELNNRTVPEEQLLLLIRDLMPVTKFDKNITGLNWL